MGFFREVTALKITPLDIRKQAFGRAFRGFDPEEVQAFLEMTAEEFERVSRENIELREREAALRGEVENYRGMEQTLQEMLRTGQQAAEKVRENGKKEARLMVKEAEILGNRAIEKARAQVQSIRSEIVDLRNQRDLFVAKFQALTQAQSDFLEQLRFTDADVVEEPMEGRASGPAVQGAPQVEDEQMESESEPSSKEVPTSGDGGE